MQDDEYRALRACGGKVAYASMSEARSAARRLSDRYGSLVTAYLCHYCSEPQQPRFHVGNHQPRGRPARKRRD